ncbi:MAG: hypothetical protein LBN93_11245 [Candidatus Symbiothrix sp.]|jgi:hypothetical protein|nr:hypothetical protein [Candidatus Symbiothrix sp.]
MKSLKNNQLYQLTVTQWLETIREPEVLFWGILFPVLLSIGMGLAFTQNSESKFRVMMVEENRTSLDSLLDVYAQPDPKDAAISIWDITDNTLGDSEFSFVRSDWKSAIVALKRGEADVIVTDSLGAVRYHFDPHNAQAQLVYMKLSALISPPAPLKGEIGRSVARNAPTAEAFIAPLTLKGVRYIDFLIPGLIAYGMMSSIMWGVSYGIIERRSQNCCGAW